MRFAALALLAAACGHPNPDPMKPPPSPIAPAPTASLELSPAGDGAWSLAAWVQNPGSTALDATYSVPWMPASFTVTDASGKPLQVTQPALDTPVQEKPLHVEPGARAKIQSAITLRFGEHGAAMSDGFVWTIDGARVPVTITCDVALDGVAPMPASAKL